MTDIYLPSIVRVRPAKPCADRKTHCPNPGCDVCNRRAAHQRGRTADTRRHERLRRHQAAVAPAQWWRCTAGHPNPIYQAHCGKCGASR